MLASGLIPLIIVGLVVLALLFQGRKAIGPLKVAADDIFGAGGRPLSLPVSGLRFGKWLAPVLILLLLAAIAVPPFLDYARDAQEPALEFSLPEAAMPPLENETTPPPDLAPATPPDFASLLPGAWRFATQPYSDSACVLSGTMTVANDSTLSCHIEAQEQCGASIVSASQTCSFTAAESKLYIESQVVSSSSSGYQPDNFELDYDGAGFVGRMTSAFDAPVTFVRTSN